METIADNLLERHMRVRAAFVARGSSLHAWCKGAGVKPANAYKAMTGQWTGPKARELVERILAASGVQE